LPFSDNISINEQIKTIWLDITKRNNVKKESRVVYPKSVYIFEYTTNSRSFVKILGKSEIYSPLPTLTTIYDLNSNFNFINLDQIVPLKLTGYCLYFLIKKDLIIVSIQFDPSSSSMSQIFQNDNSFILELLNNNYVPCENNGLSYGIKNIQITSNYTSSFYLLNLSYKFM
jgi:hypothetical protein